MARATAGDRKGRPYSVFASPASEKKCRRIPYSVPHIHYIKDAIGHKASGIALFPGFLKPEKLKFSKNAKAIFRGVEGI